MPDWVTMLTQLPDAPDTTDPEPFAGPDHPMRKLTREVAFEGGWSPGRATRVANLFDSMAADWVSASLDPTKAAPVYDALERGDLDRSEASRSSGPFVRFPGQWLEVGSGTGAGTRVLEGLVGSLVAADLSAEMLANAPAIAPKVRADASRLPFGADTFDTVLMMNMLLFPDEVDRVLRPDGRIVWVNTLGDQTPIHLPPRDVVAALPGEWTGETARSGTGFWAVLRRATP